MSAEDWKITEEHKETMSAFMGDFWQIVKASYEFPDPESADNDHYWKSLIHWSDVLMKKYGNGADPIINRVVMGYLDGQSIRQTPEKSHN